MKPNEVSEVEIIDHVTEVMHDAGVPAHLKGYRYLRAAIIIAVYDMSVVGSVTKLLYPVIAKRFKTTEQKVERAIRNAIEVSWVRGNVRTFEELFGYSAKTGQGRPTNSEYIARFADKTGMDFREKSAVEKSG